MSDDTRNDHRHDHIRALLAEIRFLDWRFHTWRQPTVGGLMFLQVQFHAPDVDTGLRGEQHCRKWVISEHMTDSEIVQTAFLAVKVALEHELREQFTFRGERIFGPHFNVFDLVVTARLSRDVRPAAEKR